MNIPADINLNYINNLRIVQEYDRAPDGSRLKTLDDMVLEAGFSATAISSTPAASTNTPIMTSKSLPTRGCSR